MSLQDSDATDNGRRSQKLDSQHHSYHANAVLTGLTVSSTIVLTTTVPSCAAPPTTFLSVYCPTHPLAASLAACASTELRFLYVPYAKSHDGQQLADHAELARVLGRHGESAHQRRRPRRVRVVVPVGVA